jgi:hypothetical protein
MAVATHVSRVAKEYAPHGYSILEEVTATVTTQASANDPIATCLNIISDADIYIEDVSVYSLEAIAASDTNFITIAVASFSEGASDEVFHVNVTTKAASLNGLVQDGIKSAGSITSPVISATPNRVLMLKITKSVANHSSINSKLLGVRVRYRRKA